MIIINEFLQSFKSEGLTNFFNIITLFGSTIGILFFYLLINIFYSTNKANLYLMFLLVGSIFILGLKRLLNVNRPFTNIKVDILDYGLTSKLNPNMSCPSGHSYIISFSTFFLLFNFKKNRIKNLPFLILMILVMVSRVYLGVHYLLDVLLGASLGFFYNYFLFYFKLYEKIKINKKYFLMQTGILIIVFIYLSITHKLKGNSIAIASFMYLPIINYFIDFTKIKKKEIVLANIMVSIIIANYLNDLIIIVSKEMTLFLITLLFLNMLLLSLFKLKNSKNDIIIQERSLIK